MPDRDVERMIAIAERWAFQRHEVFRRAGKEYNDGANAASLREFQTILNACSKELVGIIQSQNPEVYSALREVVMNCEAVLAGARTVINHQDVTKQVGG